MCGILSAGSVGSMARTSPAIQSRPSVVSNSRPREARSCMPTQMPRNGRLLAVHRLFERCDHAGNGLQSALAIGVGAYARQHDAVGCAHVLGLRADQDLRVCVRFAGGALKCLRGGVEISGTVIDDDDALHAAQCLSANLTAEAGGPARPATAECGWRCRRWVSRPDGAMPALALSETTGRSRQPPLEEAPLRPHPGRPRSPSRSHASSRPRETSGEARSSPGRPSMLRISIAQPIQSG